MSRIIEKWIQVEFGIIINSKSNMILKTTYDGKLFATILKQYNVISPEQLSLIISSRDPKIVDQNFKYIRTWLKSINFELNETVVKDLMLGDVSAAWKILFELYLHLVDKTSCEFMTKQLTKEQKLFGIKSRFDVEAVRESDNVFSPPVSRSTSFLVRFHHVITWKRFQHEALLKTCRERREHYNESMTAKYSDYNTIYTRNESTEDIPEESDLPDNDCVFSLKYGTLMDDIKRVSMLAECVPDGDNANTYVQSLKERSRDLSREEAYKAYLHKLLILEILEMVVNKYKSVFDRRISEKMLRQSNYEMQMTSKFLEARSQKALILTNQQNIMRDYLDRGDYIFNQQRYTTKDEKHGHFEIYFLEVSRNLQLHKRLQAEKKRLQKERHMKFCIETLDSIVDLALCTVEYKEAYNEQPSWHYDQEWAALFVKGQPIFKIVEYVEEIVLCTEEELEPDVEEMYQIEIIRQNALDQRYFEHYTNMDWPWDIEGLPEMDEMLNSKDLGMNVLGHIVYKLLLDKYPTPEIYSLEGLPTVTVAACVSGVTDVTILPTLQNLLVEKEVKILQMEDAINFCICTYFDEIKPYKVDKTLVEVTDITLNLGEPNVDRVPPRRKGQRCKCEIGENIISQDENIIENDICDKENQTPEKFPCEEEQVLSYTAELGKLAYEVLNLGAEISASYLVRMLMEYLKSMPHIKGWVLINYPETPQQAAALEEILTGKPVPSDILAPASESSIEDLLNLEMRNLSVTPDIDQNKKFRVSRLFEMPKTKMADYYESYMTAFIVMKHNTHRESSLLKLKGRENVEKFYADQGCNYMFTYKILNFIAIKELGKLILGECVETKMSTEIFGDTVEYVEVSVNQTAISVNTTSSKIGDKKERPPFKGFPPPPEEVVSPKKGGKAKKEKPGKAGKAKKKGKNIEVIKIVKVDKVTQEPEVEELGDTDEGPPPQPGEPGWTYIVIPFPLPQETMLATMWENIEEIYCTDLKELFFIHRTGMNTQVPYAKFVQKHITHLIVKPDERQSIIHEFQEQYNGIDEDLRDDVEMKGELHCRVEEFHDRLYLLSEEKFEETESERQQIAADNWLAKQLCEFLNMYITYTQLELNRYSDTLQFLNDYYNGIITKMPLDETLEKTILEVFTYTDENAIAFNINQYIYKCLTFTDKFREDNPVNMFVESIYQQSCSILQSLKERCQGVLQKKEALVKPKVKGAKAPKSDKSAASGKGAKKFPKFLGPEPDVVLQSEAIIQEWTCVLDGEYSRAYLSLCTMRRCTLRQVDYMITYHIDSNVDIYDAMVDRFKSEVESIEHACEVFNRATEAETKIQSRLVLEGAEFYLQPEIIFYDDPLPGPDPPIKEDMSGYIFTIRQLNRLTDILFDLAPSGHIAERRFVYLLQDIIIHDAEDSEEPFVPVMWRELDTARVSTLCQKFYGNMQFVSWKDFIIYNLYVPFPSEEQILQTREQFRVLDPDLTENVMLYQYNNVEFWFETNYNYTDPVEMLRLRELKVLLAKLFTNKEETINYTDLLLGFCKDEEWIIGLAKALELSMGQYVCWNYQEGLEFVKITLTRRYEEELRKQLEYNQSNKGSMDIISDGTYCSCEQTMFDCNDYWEFIPVFGEEMSSISHFDADSEQLSIFTKSTSMQEFTNSTECPNKIFFLPLHTLIMVMVAALPWYTKVQNIQHASLRDKIQEIYNDCRNKDFDNMVLVHEFLNNDNFKQLFAKNYKFTDKNPKKIINKLLYTL